GLELLTLVADRLPELGLGGLLRREEAHGHHAEEEDHEDLGPHREAAPAAGPSRRSCPQCGLAGAASGICLPQAEQWTRGTAVPFRSRRPGSVAATKRQTVPRGQGRRISSLTAERPSSAAGPAGKTASLEKPKCLPRLLQRLDTHHGLFATGRLVLPAASPFLLGDHDEILQPAAPILLRRRSP